jgi:beta-lactam-binding protein with PASTA domain
VVVPNVIGETEQAAVTILAQAGLQADTQSTPNAPPGIVGFQNPNPGATVPSGSTVVILVGE